VPGGSHQRHGSLGGWAPAVRVRAPAPGGGTPAPLVFKVRYPVPTVTALNPPQGVASGPATLVTVNGTGFAPVSVVQLDGADVPTTFINATQLTVLLSTDALMPPSHTVQVRTPAPGGGVSTKYGCSGQACDRRQPQRVRKTRCV